MDLTERQRELLRASLSYAFSNIDDINDAFVDDPDFSEDEVEALAKLFNIDIR